MPPSLVVLEINISVILGGTWVTAQKNQQSKPLSVPRKLIPKHAKQFFKRPSHTIITQ